MNLYSNYFLNNKIALWWAEALYRIYSVNCLLFSWDSRSTIDDDESKHFHGIFSRVWENFKVKVTFFNRYKNYY